MPIYWTLKSIPELSQLSSAERSQAWRRVNHRTWRHWQTWVGLVACGALAGLGSYFGGTFGYPLIGAAIGGALGGFIFSQASIHVARLHYKDALLGNERS
jgi:hypothetical protein